MSMRKKEKTLTFKICWPDTTHSLKEQMGSAKVTNICRLKYLASKANYNE